MDAQAEPSATAPSIDRNRLARLTAAERDRFAADHPRSRELFDRARAVMPGGVPIVTA